MSRLFHFMFFAEWLGRHTYLTACASCSSFHIPNALTYFPVVKEEITQLGSADQRIRDQEKQEAWLLMELQKLRRQIENCELRMVQKPLVQLDQGASHNLSVRINELEV